MKLVMIVLAVRFVIAWIENTIKDNKAEKNEKATTQVQHPAEFRLR